MNDPLVWMIIGVSGSGKTSVGRLLAQNLDCDYLRAIADTQNRILSK